MRSSSFANAKIRHFCRTAKLRQIVPPAGTARGGRPEQFQASTSDGLMVSTRHIYFPDIEKENSSSAGCAGFIGVFFAYREMRN